MQAQWFWGRYSATHEVSTHWQAALSTSVMFADCLPGDYNIPRNSFNSLADLQEIWYTWHWWAEAIAHHFWVEYDNSEFSVPSMGLFSDLKLFMSNVSVAVFIDQFYTKLLHRSSWSWSFYLPSSSTAQSLWEQETYAHFKIISKRNMSYCSATWSQKLNWTNLTQTISNTSIWYFPG